MKKILIVLLMGMSVSIMAAGKNKRKACKKVNKKENRNTNLVDDGKIKINIGGCWRVFKVKDLFLGGKALRPYNVMAGEQREVAFKSAVHARLEEEQKRQELLALWEREQEAIDEAGN